MSSERGCLSCDTELDGRLDQKFCSKNCRNNYNNAKYRETEAKMRDVIKILKSNRKLAMDLSERGQQPYSKEELKGRGYDFNYHTNTWSENTVNIYIFCFDYGLLHLKEKNEYIPVAWQSYME